VFTNVGKDLLEELSSIRGIHLSEAELEELTHILIRYTVGFGLIEVLLGDEKVQDITVNSPMGQIPVHLVHEEFGECKTNIFPSVQDGDSWASKLRIISGRPLDEADPILDTEIEIPNVASARVGVISPPLNPTGIAYAFRRHRDKPWTLPLFMSRKMLTPLAAGLISFIVDGNRTILVAGTRSAGKTSLLSGVLVEIMRRYRIITIEDTLELPVSDLRQLGYNIQAMKVASALSKGQSEVPADEGIRTTLRLGDSALIVGEVRSTEAKALYEAMRVGALANVVAGTIHGDSPYGVFDRVVNDLGVPRTSFKATDIIIVANPVKSADGLHKSRRITQITEVRKEWEDDPVREGGFVDLMKYNAQTDQLEPTDALLNGDSDIIKAIAGSVKDWAGNWEAVWENILLRARIKERLVQIAQQEKDNDLLEAPFIILANDMFHQTSERVRDRMGRLDTETIYFEWNDWLSRQIIKRSEKRKDIEKSHMRLRR
jgi:type IV secretory pathway ATPase VirB11/archaellum biosynthesis ATPase